MNSGELEGGFQVNGASAGENNFTVDGVPVVSLINGSQRQDAVFEYLQEVQVRTSGLEAEYGGALGGVVSAVTKSGGNRFSGSVYEHFTSDWLRSNNGIHARLVIDPVTQNSALIVQDDDQTFNRNEFGGITRRPDRQRPAVLLRIAVAPHSRSSTGTTRSATATSAVRSIATARPELLSARSRSSPSNRLQLKLPVLWTPDKATGTPIAYDGRAAEHDYLGGGFARRRATALGYEIPQWNIVVHRRLHHHRTTRSRRCAAAT